MLGNVSNSIVFFFNDTATTEIYTLSLHDALPISGGPRIILRELQCFGSGQHLLAVHRPVHGGLAVWQRAPPGVAVPLRSFPAPPPPRRAPSPVYRRGRKGGAGAREGLRRAAAREKATR